MQVILYCKDNQKTVQSCVFFEISHEMGGLAHEKTVYGLFCGYCLIAIHRLQGTDIYDHIVFFVKSTAFGARINETLHVFGDFFNAYRANSPHIISLPVQWWSRRELSCE